MHTYVDTHAYHTNISYTHAALTKARHRTRTPQPRMRGGGEGGGGVRGEVDSCKHTSKSAQSICGRARAGLGALKCMGQVDSKGKAIERPVWSNQ